MTTLATRPDLPRYLMALARAVAARSTCARRAVGCVLTDARGHIISTGHNGVPAGIVHCNEGHPCPGVDEPGGTTDLCRAIHAEQNALAHCRTPQDIYTVTVTVEPCISCLKLLLATPAKQILIGSRYHKIDSMSLWMEYGRSWLLVEE